MRKKRPRHLNSHTPACEEKNQSHGSTKNNKPRAEGFSSYPDPPEVGGLTGRSLNQASVFLLRKGQMDVFGEKQRHSMTTYSHRRQTQTPEKD